MKTYTSRSQTIALFLMLLCTAFTSTGQILWKLGLAEINFSQPLTVLNITFLLGFVFYGISFLLMLQAFKRGELSLLYPIIATSYVWVSIFSPLIFPTDSMNNIKWLGVIVILISISLLGFGSTRNIEEKLIVKTE